MQARAIKVMESFSRCPHWSISFAAADARRPYFERMVTLLDTQSVLTKPKLTLYCSPLDWALWCSTLMRRISQTDTDGRAGYYRRRLMSRNHRYCVFVMQCLETVTVTGGAWIAIQGLLAGRCCSAAASVAARLVPNLGQANNLGRLLRRMQCSPPLIGQGVFTRGTIMSTNAGRSTQHSVASLWANLLEVMERNRDCIQHESCLFPSAHHVCF